MISLAIELLVLRPKLRSYLSAAYPVVLVDEAQDTNALCYIFLNGLLSEESGICMFGDPIQCVYGFIGAMTGLKEKASTDLRLLLLELERNHRFSEGSLIGGLGAAIRSNMRGGPVGGMPRLPVLISPTQQGEAAAIVSKVAELAQGEGGRTAFLVRKRGPPCRPHHGRAWRRGRPVLQRTLLRYKLGIHGNQRVCLLQDCRCSTW